ncbi:hypothetical protein [Caminibacter pacificus]
MVVEIKDKELESFLSSLKREELVDFVEKALKERILLFDAKKAVSEVKNGKLLSEEEFFSKLKNEN